MKNVLIVVLGLGIMLTSFWGGAYFMHGNEDAWFHFPVFMTAFLGTVAGVFTFAIGFSKVI